MMPDDPRPLSPAEVDELEQSEHWKLYIVRQLFATVRDRERQRDAIQEQLDEIILKPLEPLLDAVLDDMDLQDALATDNDNMILRAERDELQRDLAAEIQMRKEAEETIERGIALSDKYAAERDQYQLSEMRKFVNCGGAPPGKTCSVDGHNIYGSFFTDENGAAICELHGYRQRIAELQRQLARQLEVSNEVLESTKLYGEHDNDNLSVVGALHALEERVLYRERQLAEARKAIHALLVKWDAIEPVVNGHLALEAVHGRPYTGPNMAGELTELRRQDPARDKEPQENIASIVEMKEDMERLERDWERQLAEARKDTERLDFVLEHLVIYDEYGFGKRNLMEDTRRVYDTRGAIDDARGKEPHA